ITECEESPQCYNGTLFRNTNGFYECQCFEGWRGPNCGEGIFTDIDECNAKADPVCQNNGSCTNTNGSFSCDCKDGWDGPICIEDHSVQSYLDNVEYWNNPENQRRQLETLNETITEIKKNLTLDKTRLQSSINKRISADDPRLSAAVAGYIGALFISIVIGFFLMLDCIGLCLKSN
ncbi:adhesion G protein-coupled receptor L4-like, partial [Saccostrea cucullata]|uniref:adhesion G protein-coupled receptor L4-like n=1 Tax=Saccostrea cuccullata TaxID=36930 RepID=UPI002ED5317E